MWKDYDGLEQVLLSLEDSHGREAISMPICRLLSVICSERKPPEPHRRGAFEIEALHLRGVQ